MRKHPQDSQPKFVFAFLCNFLAGAVLAVKCHIAVHVAEFRTKFSRAFLVSNPVYLFHPLLIVALSLFVFVCVYICESKPTILNLHNLSFPAKSFKQAATPKVTVRSLHYIRFLSGSVEN